MAIQGSTSPGSSTERVDPLHAQYREFARIANAAINKSQMPKYQKATGYIYEALLALRNPQYNVVKKWTRAVKLLQQLESINPKVASEVNALSEKEVADKLILRKSSPTVDGLNRGQARFVFEALTQNAAEYPELAEDDTDGLFQWTERVMGNDGIYEWGSADHFLQFAPMCPRTPRQTMIAELQAKMKDDEEKKS